MSGLYKLLAGMFWILLLAGCQPGLPSGCPPDCLGAKLSRRELAGANLTASTPRGAGSNLRGVLAQGTVLTGASLNGSDLSGARLEGAVLAGISLEGMNLIGAVLTNADLRNSNLSGALLAGANLMGANLTNTNLLGADLHGASLEWSDLRGSQLVSSTSDSLPDTDLLGITYNDMTRWPEGFVPPATARIVVSQPLE